MLSKKSFFVFFIIITTNIFLFVSSSAQNHEPDLNWLTLKTGHFFIHFPEGAEKLAQKVSFLCEDVYEPVSNSLNYYPKNTHVIVHTRSDFSNGFVAPLPWRMELFVTEPQENWIGSKDSWLRVLITHEFTHVVHLRKTKGLSTLTHPLFGELNGFWQALTPHWFIEGFSTFNETRFTNGGRGKNPYHMMTMLAPIKANNPWSLKNSNYISRKKLPVGMFYISGYYLSNYIHNKYGSDIWAKVLDRYSSFPVLGFGNALKKYTGKSQKQLYLEMITTIDSWYPERKPSLSPMFFWTGRKETDRDRYLLERPVQNDHSPRWVDNNSLVVYRNSFDELPALIRINRDGGSEKIIERSLTNPSNSFALAENFLVWTELKSHQRFSATVYSDVRIKHLESAKTRKLTDNSRIYSIDLSPDEKKLVGIQNHLNSTSLAIIHIDSGRLEPILEIPNFTLLNPRWSSSGNFIVFALKDSTGRQDIAVLDTKTKNWHFLYQPDIFHDNNPCWSPDDQIVFFSSDRSGIFNIWAVEVRTGQKWQVTDVELGVFAPDVSPDGKSLAFSYYTYSGFIIATILIDKSKWIDEDFVKHVETFFPFTPENPEKVKPDFSKSLPFTPDSYNIWPQVLKPQGWLPLIFDTEGKYSPGLFALSEDALHRHSWQGSFGVSLETKTPFFDYIYRYSRFWPEFSLNVFNNPKKVSYRGNQSWWREQGFQLSAALPLTLESNVYSTFFRPYFGYRYENQKLSTGILIPRYNHYRGLNAGFLLVRGSRTRRDVVSHRSVSLFLSGDWTDPILNSEFKGSQISSRLNLIFPTFIKHHQVQFLTAYQNRRGNYGFGFFGSLPIGYDDDGKRQQFRIKSAYHFPLAYTEWPLPFFPVYFDYLAGTLFFDWGTSWNHGSGQNRWSEMSRFSTGLQLTLTTIVFQSLPVNFGMAIYYRSRFKDWRIRPMFSFSFF